MQLLAELKNGEYIKVTEKISPWVSEKTDNDYGYNEAWTPNWIGIKTGGKIEGYMWSASLQYGLGGYVPDANQFISSMTVENSIQIVYKDQIGSSFTYIWFDGDDRPFLSEGETPENIGGSATIY